MQTNTSNRWLPLRGQHPFKIHMQPLKHACRNRQTRTITLPTYTRQQPPPLCSHAPLSCTSCLPCLRAAEQSVCEAQKSLSAAESYNQTPAADFAPFHCAAPPCPGCGFAVKPWCVWWMNGSFTEVETLCLGLFGLFRHTQRLWMPDSELQVRPAEALTGVFYFEGHLLPALWAGGDSSNCQPAELRTEFVFSGSGNSITDSTLLIWKC